MTLRGFSNIADSTLTNDIRNNVISFFDYGLLEKSNFISVNIPQSGYYGGSDYRLRKVNDPRYSGNKVWQAHRQNWVWESGVGANVGTNDAKPGISGIYIGSGFYSTSTTGTYAYHVNYPLGQVIFANSIAATAIVEANFSYRYINVTDVDGLQWFKEVHKHSEHSESQDFIKQSGDYGNLAQNRLQLPAIGVEIAGERNFKPYQLGGGQKAYTTIRFHCVAEDKYTRDNLVDIVSLQNDSEFRMYNLNEISDSGKFPLDYRGVPNSGALRYTDLVAQFEGNGIRLFDMRLESMYSLGSLFIGTVKCNSEVIVGG